MMVPPHLRPELTRLGALWAGHDAGCYQLPAALLDTRAALDRLLAAPDPATEDTGAQARLIAATVAAARDGADWPSVDVLLDAELDQQRAALRRRVLVEAVEVVASSLLVDTQRSGSALITEYLRPALDTLLDKLRAHAKAVVNLDAEGALRAGGQASKAWLTFDRGAEQYRALRAARQSLALVGVAAGEDASGLFAEVRNLPDVCPDTGRCTAACHRRRGRRTRAAASPGCWPTTPTYGCPPRPSRTPSTANGSPPSGNATSIHVRRGSSSDEREHERPHPRRRRPPVHRRGT